MLFSPSTLVLFLALAASGSAASDRTHVKIPISKRIPHSHAHAHRRGVFDLKSAERQRARIVARHFPGNEQDVERRGGTGSEALVDHYKGRDIAYYGTISIGSPAQQTTVDFDTASADLIIPLTSCANCTGPLFNSSASSTFKITTTDFSQNFADGSAVSGKVATDNVKLAGLTVKNQGFAAATVESGRYNKLGVFAGIMGLAFPPLANTKKNPYFINLASQKRLVKNIFSFYLARNGASGSELCLGCSNSAKYTGKLQYFPVDYQDTFGVAYYWNVATAGLTWKGKPLATTKYPLILDTGTTFIFVPADNAKALYAKIPGSAQAPELGTGYYKFPCNATLSSMAFRFGTTDFAIHPADFNGGKHPKDSSFCVGGVLALESGNQAVAGDAFLKNWYTVYDYDKMRVGFAPAKH